MLQSEVDEVQSLLNESLSKAPAERRAALEAIVEAIGKGIKPSS
jgi:hypothetical protein